MKWNKNRLHTSQHIFQVKKHTYYYCSTGLISDILIIYGSMSYKKHTHVHWLFQSKIHLIFTIMEKSGFKIFFFKIINHKVNTGLWTCVIRINILTMLNCKENGSLLLAKNKYKEKNTHLAWIKHTTFTKSAFLTQTYHCSYFLISLWNLSQMV